ncbi:molybdopterin molybdotransferase MoeA [Seonamhaeicola aphaedonensis]|uniref:Molybdopterin molybdenumtransferase n=1 Tax=Seonamhaeicola aphaedonensis TaxID=1461338 RepID=A0A3D9H5Z8_9FLAO|nr:gephyrin-like molybdotransferase Glp [Seonamhaeicola aphaedonensis]RED44904.1 molybdopterin molybdochelatase [Seonamhaeicola aphaedonensis]
MISIEDALFKVKRNVNPLLKEDVKAIEKANGYHLSKDVISPINMPPFRQSAMDGYALNLHDDLNYRLIDEVKAGDGHQPNLKPGEAVRIFTGAPVPDSANAIMMQEKVITNNDTITIDHQINLEQNIRPLGEQVKQGDIALKRGTKLTPAGIGYLTSLGITKVSVYKKPTLAIVTTGNELIEPGQELQYGQIYESNSKMLQSVLYSLKFYDVSIYKVADDYPKTVDLLKSVINKNDLVLITGGISVGDYDYVGKALNELQVEEIFYKVNQKPGKPLFFGKKANTSIFALPGNPAAALTCFYVYVYIALQNMMDRTDTELPRIQATSLSKFVKRGDRPQFLKAIYNNGNVELLEGQNSSMLQTFALSNALVFVPAEISEVNIGDALETIVLPV